ncbi:MAG: translation initiation factor IF-2 N-terminal domain-containing protein, partial [Phycisphaerales bacterium]|nr:translation initiation factor IF-2 N-terminal domain-containing protein [Phycisphaerales bacterium]
MINTEEVGARRSPLVEKMRVHILAKELNVSSKTIIDKCKAEGIDTVKNHMSTLSAGLHATIIEWFSEGQHATSLETAEPVDLKKVRIRRRPKSGATAATETGRPGDDEHADSVVATEALEERHEADAGGTDHIESADDELTVVAEVKTTVTAAETAETMPASEQPAIGVEQPEALQPTAAAATPPESTRSAPAEIEEGGPTGIEESAPAKAKPRKSVVPAGPQNIPAAAKLQGPRVVRYETPEYDVAPRRRPVGIGPRAGESRPPGGPGSPPTDAGKAPEKDAGRRKGRFNTRRGTGRVAESGEQLSEWRDRDLLERKERLAGATGRRIHRRRSPTTGSTPSTEPAEKASATVHEPVRMKEFCGATGLNFIQLFKVLRDQYGIMGNVNMTIPTETAQLLALHHGIELEVVRARTSLD